VAPQPQKVTDRVAIVKVSLRCRVTVAKLDAAGLLCGTKHLDMHIDLLVSLAQHCLIFELELIARYAIARSCVTEKLNKGDEIINWVACREELSVAELEKRAVAANRESLIAFLKAELLHLISLVLPRDATEDDTLQGWLCLLASFLFLFAIALRLRVHDFFAAGEVCAPADLVDDGTLKPRVLQDLLYGGSLGGIERHHTLE